MDGMRREAGGGGGCVVHMCSGGLNGKGRGRRAGLEKGSGRVS